MQTGAICFVSKTNVLVGCLLTCFSLYLYVGLSFSHVPQGAVIKQDSILELLLLQPQDKGAAWRPLWQREANAGSSLGELVLLQRQHSLLQEELLRLRDAESRFKDSERARAKLERHLKVSQQLAEPAAHVRTAVFVRGLTGPI